MKNHHQVILALGINDLRYPVHGSARIQLSTLGALALGGSTVIYFRIFPESLSQHDIFAVCRYGESSFKQICVPNRFYQDLIRNMSLLHAIDTIMKQLDLSPDLIFCLDRRVFLLGKRLSLKFGVPLVLFHDALRYMPYKDLLKISLTRVKDAFLIPIALSSYVGMSIFSDISIAVTDHITSFFRKILLGHKVYTINPTFMLLGNSLTLYDEIPSFEQIPDNLVLYSGPLDVISYIAPKTPTVNYVITGPASFYAKRLGLDKLQNIYLLHNISDPQLLRLHEKIRLSVLVRRIMTGISTTLIQELYFGKPILANSTSTLGLEKLSNLGIIEIEDNPLKLPTRISSLLEDESRLKEMSSRGLRFFNEYLSPHIYFRNYCSIVGRLIK